MTTISPDATTADEPTRAAAAAPQDGARSSLTGVLLVITSILSLQVGSGYATTLFSKGGAVGVSALRLCLAATVLLVLTRPRLFSWTRAQWKTVLAFAASMAFMNGFFYLALAHLPFGIALAIEFLGPLGLAAALSRRPRDLLWVVLALTGVSIIGVHNAGTGHLNVGGVIFALLAASGWAAYIVLGARVSRVVPGHQGLAAGLAAAGLMVLPFAVLSTGTALFSPALLLPGLVVAVFASVLPYACEMQALKSMPKKTFSVLLALEPAVGVLTGAVMLGQLLDWLTIAAICLVVVAGIGATLAAPRAPRRRGSRRTDPGQAVLT